MLEMNVGVALSEVPVNVAALIDDTDFKTREESVVYNQAGLDLVWNFLTADGAFTQTAVTPTTAGDYDWTNQGNGMYTIEIPASGGASINNNQIGVGWFTGFATGILPWTGPLIKFGVGLVHQTTIATLASQISFTLTAGSGDDDAYNGYLAVIRDVAGSAQTALGVVSDYTGISKTVALEADPGIFTMAAGDYIALVPAPDGLTVQQKADVNAEADTALTDYDPPTKAELDVLGTAALATAADLATVDGIVDQILADTGTDGVVIATATMEAIADALLGRNIDGGSNTGRIVKQALKRLRNRVADSGGTVTVYDEDDTTPNWTAALSRSAADAPSDFNPA